MEASGSNTILILIQAAIAIISIVSLWKVFEKAGRPGWAALVPFYNLYMLLQVAGKPGWWLILLLIPVVNFVIAFLVMKSLAEAFGKGMGFAAGLYFLGFIFFPILGFGEASYGGPAATSKL